MTQDDAAFTEFVATRSVSLLRTAYLLTGDRHQAEDLLQTALIRAYPRWGRVREPRAAESHVRRAMVRTLINLRTRHAWSRELTAADPPDIPTPVGGDEVDTRVRLWPMVLGLPPRQRAVIVLRYYEDLTEPQAAEILGCSVGAVKSHNARALSTLRVPLHPTADISLEDQLRTELRAEAADLEASAEFVIAALADVQARRQRRRKRAMVAVLAIAVGTAIGGFAAGADNATDDSATDDSAPTVDDPIPPLPEPPQLAPDSLQKAPTTSEMAALPWRETALPRSLPADIAAAPALSNDPIDHALALVGGSGGTVGVVGDDGRLRRLDGVALEPTRDPEGYGASPVKYGALTPDGRLAAFPQPDEVVVVDLASGDSKRFDVSGTNTWVTWHPNQRQVLIGREGGPSSVLDTMDGSVTAVPYDAYNATYAPDGTVVEITETPAGPSVSDLVRWRDSGSATRLPLSVWLGSEASPSATDARLLIAGSGDQVVRTAARYDVGWIVLDIDTGQPIAMLGGGRVPYSDWVFGLIGWLDDDTAIVQAHGYLLAWTPDTGATERVTALPGYDLSLAMDALE